MVEAHKASCSRLQSIRNILSHYLNGYNIFGELTSRLHNFGLGLSEAVSVRPAYKDAKVQLDNVKCESLMQTLVFISLL